MMVLIRFWKSLTKKGNVKSAIYEIYYFFLLEPQFQDVFVTDPDPDFSGSDADFWPTRIRTQNKKADPDLEKKPGSEAMVTGTFELSNEDNLGKILNNFCCIRTWKRGAAHTLANRDYL